MPRKFLLNKALNTTEDNVVIFDVNNDIKDDGISITDSTEMDIVTSIGTSASNYQIPTANAVRQALTHIPYLTIAPSSENTDGLAIVVLNSEPITRYDGYFYIITE